MMRCGKAWRASGSTSEVHELGVPATRFCQSVPNIIVESALCLPCQARITDALYD